MSTRNARRHCRTTNVTMVCPPVFGRVFPFAGKPNWLAAAIGLLVVSGSAGPLRAEAIAVPNASFESPVTEFVDTRIDSWQKTPKPFWYDEGANGPWDQLTGLFVNTPPEDSRHIDNCDAAQAIFLFAVPEVGLFQDYDSTDWANPTPTHAFDTKFEVGRSYDLTVGVIGGGMGMVSGVTLRISLYYRDAASNRVTVASTSITHAPAVFTNLTHLVDFQVRVPAVQAGDAWAGQNIGIELLSTVDPTLVGGFWDLDHIRLTSLREPVLRGAALLEGRVGFTLESEPGLRFEILASPDLTLPLATWTSIGTVTNATGSVSFTDPAAASLQRFYRARELP